jgi:3-oxoacyl-[acyl-carrier-protein] synthase II
MLLRRTEAWITGIGLVSSLGEGVEAHLRYLGPRIVPTANINDVRFAPYSVHPLAEIDFSRQIPRTSDQRQMERWQRIGVYAAGLALADAGIVGQPELLDRIDLSIAAGNGERDLALDGQILETLEGDEDFGGTLNHQLATGLRPTLYLGQLSNLLAGNISIVHKAAGSSRTFKGEEMAGVAAIEDAVRRLGVGQSELMLVGGALNAEREDLLLNLELGASLLRGGYRSVWRRRDAGGGMVPGSIGAFLVLETPAHANARGARAYASITAVVSDRSPRRPNEAAASARALSQRLGSLVKGHRPLAILSGASGVEPATSEERRLLEDLTGALGSDYAMRAYGNVLGHGIEAHFVTGVALAALALSKQSFYPPCDAAESTTGSGADCRQVLVTSFGHYCGEALGLVEAVEERPCG